MMMAPEIRFSNFKRRENHVPSEPHHKFSTTSPGQLSLSLFCTTRDEPPVQRHATQRNATQLMPVRAASTTTDEMSGDEELSFAAVKLAVAELWR